MAKVEKETQLNNLISVDCHNLERDFKVSNFEKDLIKKYLKKVLKNITGDELEIELINSNFFYESYSIVSDNKKFILKISLDPENNKLNIEKNCLNSVSDLVSPSVINYTLDNKNGIEFLLTTWENSENFDFYGINDLVYNLGTLSCVLDTVHESDTSKIPTFQQNFLQNESVVSLLDVLDDKEIKIFEILVDLDKEKLINIFSRIRSEFDNKYSEDFSVLCHSNLKKSNILYQSGYIKFINFENCHTSDIYYSLLKAVNNLELYYSKKTVTSFLTMYHKNSKILADTTLSEFLTQYEKKKEFNRILLFQDLLHKIILHFNVYGSFGKCKSLMHYMNIYLNLKPTIKIYFPEFISSFDKLFFTPVPTVKTYDLEELEIIAQM